MIVGAMPKWRRYFHRCAAGLMLSVQQMQMRPLPDIREVREWRGRGGPLGYRLLFRDKQRVYLEYSVSNSIVLAERLRANIAGF